MFKGPRDCNKMPALHHSIPTAPSMPGKNVQELYCGTSRAGPVLNVLYPQASAGCCHNFASSAVLLIYSTRLPGIK